MKEMREKKHRSSDGQNDVFFLYTSYSSYVEETEDGGYSPGDLNSNPGEVKEVHGGRGGLFKSVHPGLFLERE